MYLPIQRTSTWTRFRAGALGVSLGFAGLAAFAATPILNFDFNEGTPETVKESLHGLTGTPSDPAPTMVTDTPSKAAGDRAIQFESGQYLTMDDPNTSMQLNPDDPSFTLQAWVKFSGQPTGRMVFFYSNGPGGAISFSVNTDRSVFVTTLGILDANSEAVIPDDELWHHIAVVHENGKELRYYVDGVLGATREYTSGVIFTRTQNVFTIGAEPGGGLPFIGSLDRLQIVSGILTPEQLDSKPSTAPAVDTDKDGMPDDYEKEKGFNPNDPSDAAKDFDGDGVSNLDEYKAGTDPIDVTKPTIVSAAASSTFDTIQITLSEEIDPATATVAANYTITPALAISSATYNRKVVTLTTAKQTPGGTAYTIDVKGLKDTSKNEIAAGTKAVVYSYVLARAGQLKISVWEAIDGTPVDNLYNDPRYPADPTSTGVVFSFNSRDYLPSDALNSYGAVIEGHLIPTEAGNYRFFVYSDDASQLFLSTDDKAANLVQIAEETGCCNFFTEPDSPRTSEPIALTAGTKYYIRLVYKEGGGGDYGQVAWRKEGDKTPAGSLTPIAGKFLASAEDLPAPAEGVLVAQSPAPGAKQVNPTAKITVAHKDGKTAWTAQNVTFKYDGAVVTPTAVKEGSTITFTYDPPGLLASESTHTVTLGYQDPGGNPATLEWSFTAAPYTGPVKDKLHGYEGLILGIAAQDADKSGFDGKAGNKAINNGTKNSGNTVLIYDATWLNAATGGDKLTASFWQKRTDVTDSSMIWFDSLSSSSGNRGFQAHTPWSNNNVYFDTAGCCDGTTQRISNDVTTFPSWSGDNSWWYTWRHFAFVKDGGHKSIYIDGELFHEGDNSGVLPTDFERIWLGAEGGGTAGKGNNFHGSFDDFAVYGSALTPANVKSLATGSAPTSLGAAANLLAYWDFNDDLSSGTAPTITSVSRVSGGSVKIEWAAGTLQSADSVAGPWADVAGATSPYQTAASGAAKFWRLKK